MNKEKIKNSIYQIGQFIIELKIEGKTIPKNIDKHISDIMKEVE